MILYTPTQFVREVMKIVKQWQKYHGPRGQAYKFVQATGKEDLLYQIRYIQLKYRLAENNQDKWLVVQAAMSLGHTGDGYLIDIWGNSNFAYIVNLIRTEGALAYFDRSVFERWLYK